jgi:hypothetical protein
MVSNQNWSVSMTHEKYNKASKPRDAGDTDASLQKELSREMAEGADSIGDVASNRTVSGSSSWETSPDKNAAGSNPKSGKESEQARGAASRKKKR